MQGIRHAVTYNIYLNLGEFSTSPQEGKLQADCLDSSALQVQLCCLDPHKTLLFYSTISRKYFSEASFYLGSAISKPLTKIIPSSLGLVQLL